MRFSLTWLLLIVAAAALASMSLISVSEVWANLLFTLAFGTLLYSLLRAILTGGRSRAFSLGFFLFGSTYMIAVFVGKLPAPPRWFGPRNPIEQSLVTTTLLESLYPLVSKEVDRDSIDLPSRFPISRQETTNVPGQGRVRQLFSRIPFYLDYARAGHSLFVLLFGLLGGCLGRRIYSSTRPSD